MDGLLAGGSYDAYRASMNSEGWVEEKFRGSVVDQLRESLKVEQKVPVARVADFRIAKEIFAERIRKPEK